MNTYMYMYMYILFRISIINLSWVMQQVDWFKPSCHWSAPQPCNFKQEAFKLGYLSMWLTCHPLGVSAQWIGLREQPYKSPGSRFFHRFSLEASLKSTHVPKQWCFFTDRQRRLHPPRSSPLASRKSCVQHCWQREPLGTVAGELSHGAGDPVTWLGGAEISGLTKLSL